MPSPPTAAWAAPPASSTRKPARARARRCKFALSDEVRSLVRFDQLNLYDDVKMKQMSNFDIVFCANVLIYFDMNSKIKVVSHLYNSLVRDGTLFIGYAESLHGISKAFKVIHFPKTIAYKNE